jgi:hypothetical protein
MIMWGTFLCDPDGTPRYDLMGEPSEVTATATDGTVSAGKMNYSWFQFDLPPGRYRVDWRVHGQCWSAEGDVPEGGTLKVFVSG